MMSQNDDVIQTNIFIVNMAIADTISIFRLLMKVDYELNGKLWRNSSIFNSEIRKKSKNNIFLTSKLDLR